MRQKLFIFGALLILILVLIGLNAASYVQKEKQPDNELRPNRSSYNTGATGTRAFYDLLSETGRPVVRWQQPPDALLNNKNAPQTFILIGALRREFDEAEAAKLLRWVSEGGRLIIIDREPPASLTTTTAGWRVSFTPESEFNVFGVDPSDQNQMTDKVSAAKPVQPTVITRFINAVQPSRLASNLNFERYADTEPAARYEDYEEADDVAEAPPVIGAPRSETSDNSDNTGNSGISGASENPADQPPAFSAPVVHLANDKKNIVVEVPFGAGQIAYLSDPFVVSNGGINMVDNAQLAVNLAAARRGLIAFDEYHQGYGSNNNRLLQYFADTPVPAIFLQIILLIALVFFSQSRRFARALPETEPNRLSKLEYVAAMAELQRRTKAFDLAVENIYADFRRRAARTLGVDNFTVSRAELARLIAERISADGGEIERLMQKCEEIVHGEKTNKKEVLRISSRLREIEEKLGLKRSRRTRI